MSKPIKIDCMFCGDRNVDQGLEDVFPLWLARKLAYVAQLHHPEQQPTYTDYSYENLDTFRADAPSAERAVGAIPKPYKLPGVCITCNGGWMSRLEDAAKLVMVGLILGNEPKPIAPYDQLVLSTWMIKTCLTYDAARPPRRLISEAEGSRRFFANPFPLPCLILIGHDADIVPQGELLHQRGWETGQMGISPDTEVQVHMARLSFQFDHLILKAQIYHGEAITNYGVWPSFGPPDSPYFHQIWPPVERFDWPSNAALIPRADSNLLPHPPDGD